MNYYIKLWYRSLKREKFFTVLKIISMTMSLGISLVLMFIISNQYNFDKSNPNIDNIFRLSTSIVDNNNETSNFATVSYGLQRFITSDKYEDIISVTPISLNASQKGLTNAFNIKGAITNKSFFKQFPFKLIGTNSDIGLSNPDKIYISKSLANKIFGDLACEGKNIVWQGFKEFIVQGVFDEDSYKSHLNYDFYISDSNLGNLVSQGIIDSTIYNINSVQPSYTYLVLKEKISEQNIKNELAKIKAAYLSNTKLPESVKDINLELHSIKDISPRRNNILDNSQAMSIDTIAILATFVICVLILACLNYSVLTFSSSIKRSKELAIRKVLGSNKKDLLAQLVCESFMMLLICFIFGILLSPLIWDFFPLNFKRLTTEITFVFILSIIILLLIMSFVSGTIPAYYLSKIKELHLFQKLLRKRNTVWFLRPKNLLIIFQFSISTALVMFVLVIYNQTRFMQTYDYGFNKNNVFNIKIKNSDEYRLLKAELPKYSIVNKISGSSSSFGYTPKDHFKISNVSKLDKFDAACFYIDENLIENMGLQIKYGHDFGPDSNFNKAGVIINELCARNLGFNNERDAIDNVVKIDTSQFVIKAVVKDFQFDNFKRPISPLILLFSPANFTIVTVTTNPANKERFKNIYEAGGLDRILNRKVEVEDFERSLSDGSSYKDEFRLISFVSIAFLCLAVLGFSGIVLFSTLERTSEMTIRKILGASKTSIFVTLAQEFLCLLLVGASIGIAIGYLISTEFLNQFYYRSQITFVSIFMSFLFIILLGLGIMLLINNKILNKKPVLELEA